MELHPLDPLGLARPDPVAEGWAHRLASEPRTLDEILRSASAGMDAEDDRQERERDPVAWLRASRRRRTLWARLFGR